MNEENPMSQSQWRANLKEEHRFGVPRGEGEQGEVQLVIQPFWGWRGGG